MQNSNLINLTSVIVLIWHLCTALNAHEFWIEPDKFIVESDEKISANLKVGQMMNGVSYGYYPKRFNRFELKTQDKIRPVSGRLGDKPAINIKSQGNHLVTIIYSTTDSIVSYNEWPIFEKFLIEKSLMAVKAEHLVSNFPKTQFKEIYSRYAKTLIGSGNSHGKDQYVGLEIELVLNKNPYKEDMTNGLAITLFYQGVPQVNTQIEVFSRAADKKVRRDTIITNEYGRVTIEVSSQTDYMINAVIMRKPGENKLPAKTSKQPIIWESLWASTSFRVP